MSANDAGAGGPATVPSFGVTGYGAYLQLDRLLATQEPRTEAHEEIFFIVIHQTFELWFKLLIHELRALRQHLVAGDAENALHPLRRITRIQTLLVDQIRLIDTLSPAEFLRFRPALGTSSGLESQQFRTIESLLGLPGRRNGAASAWMARSGEPAVDEAIWACFVVRGHLTAGSQTDSAARRAAAVVLFQAPAADPALAFLCEELLDLAQSLWLWRATHLKVVDRLIGGRMGTGGTTGVTYLARTLDSRAFPDLWAAHGSLEP
ncbi:MAG: tryptophan 2,3-dioxygenase [Chloroflexi bacterium]|nr:tryptophan 2,3-dioxygenase [Chloroflexota bacterium]